MIQEVEIGTVLAAHKHEVDPGTPVTLDEIKLVVQLAVGDVLHGHPPVENAKLEFQHIWGKLDHQFAVVDRVKSEKAGKEAQYAS